MAVCLGPWLNRFRRYCEFSKHVQTQYHTGRSCKVERNKKYMLVETILRLVRTYLYFFFTCKADSDKQQNNKFMLLRSRGSVEVHQPFQGPATKGLAWAKQIYEFIILKFDCLGSRGSEEVDIPPS